MKSKNKFNIGEFSKLNRITVKTLRHYEEIGLLKPNEVDEWTGYRYYDVSQFQKVTTIMYLKSLRFSLSEIRDLFDQGLDTPSVEMLSAKIEQCRTEQEQLQWQYDELRILEKNLKKGNKMERVSIKTLPEVLVASYRKVVKDYDELFDLCPNVIGSEMQRCGCTCDTIQYGYTLELSKDHKTCNFEIEYCEAVDAPFTESDVLKCKKVPEVKTAACINHIGDYKSFQQTMAELMNYIEQHNYKIVDSPRYCYIDGIWNKENPAEWLTEIQVPVEMV